MNLQEDNLLPSPALSEELPNPPWYVIYSCSRHEIKVEAGLTRKGLEVFLPRVKVRSRRRDRLKMLEVPLFPGYLFVHSELNDWIHNNIIRNQGVVRILGIKGQFTPVPEETVASLRTLVNSGEPVFPWPKLIPGKQVRVVGGPLRGAIGVILSNKRRKEAIAGGGGIIRPVGMRRIR